LLFARASQKHRPSEVVSISLTQQGTRRIISHD
jgi:hypothetical protein